MDSSIGDVATSIIKLQTGAMDKAIETLSVKTDVRLDPSRQQRLKDEFAAPYMKALKSLG